MNGALGGAVAYAALGDSFTAGTGCPPGARWPDRLAQALRSESPELAYRNLAEHGADTARVLEHQAPLANQLEPALASVICGANDVLESVRPDVAASAARFEAVVERLREGVSGVLVVTATVPESWRFLELGPRTRARIRDGLRDYNERLREIAAAEDLLLLEVAAHPGLEDPANFSRDGLHPSPAGHRHFADAMLILLDGHLSRVRCENGEEL